MKVSAFFLAEGIAQDASGAYSAIRIGQNLVFSATLPAQTKRSIFFNVVEEGNDLVPGTQVTVRFSITSPSGVPVAGSQLTIPIGAKPWPDLPADLTIPAEFVFSLPEYGEYAITASMMFPDGTEIGSSLPLNVLVPIGGLSREAIEGQFASPAAHPPD
jgi:hypothetical protein